MRLTAIALVTALTLVAGASPIPTAAQQSPARPVPSAVGSLTGAVTNGATGDPLRAEISIDRPRRSARTDSVGRFAFRDIPAGRVRLRAISFGFEPADTLVVVRGGEVVTVSLRLRAVPQSLAEVRTVAKSPERTSRHADLRVPLRQVW